MTNLNKQLPNNESLLMLYADDFHFKVPVLRSLLYFHRKIELTFRLGLLIQLGDHHNDWTSFAPQHSVKIWYRVRQGSLRGYVRLFLSVIALKINANNSNVLPIISSSCFAQ